MSPGIEARQAHWLGTRVGWAGELTVKAMVTRELRISYMIQTEVEVAKGDVHKLCCVSQQVLKLGGVRTVVA